MLIAKSKARKQDIGLTVTQATRQARKIVNSGLMMPGPFATVDSRKSADPVTLEPVIITTITFPANEHGAALLSIELLRLGGQMIVADSSITVTRKIS
jgi:hypothetical protein